MMAGMEPGSRMSASGMCLARGCHKTHGPDGRFCEDHAAYIGDLKKPYVAPAVVGGDEMEMVSMLRLTSDAVFMQVRLAIHRETGKRGMAHRDGVGDCDALARAAIEAVVRTVRE